MTQTGIKLNSDKKILQRKRQNVASETLTQKLFAKGKVYTISNGLSLLRLLGSFYLYYLTIHHQSWTALWAAVLLILTDFLDGYFARRLNQVSELGKVLDPLADKVGTGLGVFALYQEYGLPFWVMALIIGRDIAIVLGSLMLMSRLPYVVPSAMPGKIAVTILAFLFLVYLLEIYPLQYPLLLLSVLAIGISSLFYAYRFLNTLKQKSTER